MSIMADSCTDAVGILQLMQWGCCECWQLAIFAMSTTLIWMQSDCVSKCFCPMPTRSSHTSFSPLSHSRSSIKVCS